MSKTTNKLDATVTNWRAWVRDMGMDEVAIEEASQIALTPMKKINFKDKLDIIEALSVLDKKLERSRWTDKIPFIQFPSNWLVKAIPSYDFAIIRYHISNGDKQVSVYLDCYDLLGCYGEPYWEVYPYRAEDTARCKMNDIDELLSLIGECFNQNADAEPVDLRPFLPCKKCDKYCNCDITSNEDEYNFNRYWKLESEDYVSCTECNIRSYC